VPVNAPVVTRVTGITEWCGTVSDRSGNPYRRSRRGSA